MFLFPFVLQNGEGDCGRVPDGRTGAQVLRGPLLVLSAAPLHHLDHASGGQLYNQIDTYLLEKKRVGSSYAVHVS